MKNKKISQLLLILTMVLLLLTSFLARPAYALSPPPPPPPTPIEIIANLVIYLGPRLVVVTVTTAFLLSLIFRKQSKPIKQIWIAAGVVASITLVLVLIFSIFNYIFFGTELL